MRWYVACTALHAEALAVREDAWTLVDRHGRVVDARVQRVLVHMLPRLRRQFPSVRDEVTIVEVLEEAAERVRRREERGGTIERLHGYAWVTLRSVATSRLRRGEARIADRTLAGGPGVRALAAAPATSHTHADLDRRILLRQILTTLTPSEQRVCAMKLSGYSTREIARVMDRTAVSVDTLYCRARAKARRRCAADGSQMRRSCATDAQMRRSRMRG